jgi:glucodextranase-like protein
VTVTGTSSDPGGAVKTVTVNGTAATLAADGSWSAPLTLAPGSNTITAVATDGPGNSGSAQETLTFIPPDKTPPVLALAVAKVKLAALIKRGLPVTVGCSEACSFRVDLILSRALAKKLHAARVYSIGRKSSTMTAAGKKKFRVKLRRKAARALRKAKKLRKLTFKVKVVAKDGAGNVASKTKKVTVRR